MSGLAAPCYTAEKLEVVLRPAAAAVAFRSHAARPAGLGGPHEALGRLGVPGLDQAAVELGAWFEPEFRGEQPPADPREPDFTAYYLAHLPAGGSLSAALDRFAACAEVAAADPIAILPAQVVPDDSLWSRAYWHYQTSRHDIHSPEAWDVTTGDSAIVVAIIDTGLLPYHPDLQGNIWSNPAEVNGTPGVDDDGNGFVDDTWGWDFVDHPAGTSGIIPGEDTVDQDPDPNDFAGHGTFVAGVVGAKGNNGIGPAGVAWQVRLMALRIGWSTYSDPLGQVDMSFAAQALRYATRMHANIVNCSFATLNTNGLYAAAQAATHAGVVIVSAAGNNGSPHDLADRSDVIAVAATNQNDVVALYSNTGPFVDVAAPGTFFFSTYIRRPGSDSLGLRQPDYSTVQTALSGTSFSSPLVAGSLALVQSLRRARGERLLSPMGALLRIEDTADDISAENPVSAGYGAGRLNVYRALTDPPRSLAWPGGARTVGPAVAFDEDGRTVTAWLTSAQQLLITDPATGDTLAVGAMPAMPARHLAGARMGGGVGMALFAGTSNGKLAGFDSTCTLLPGWPVSGPTGITPALSGGPVLADIDGDGVRDVVCGSDDGKVWVWRVNGTRLPNFPVTISALGAGIPVACASLDGAPGADIVAVNREGELHVLGPDGVERAGFPVTLGGTPYAPAIAWQGDSARIVVASMDTMLVLDPDGNVRASVKLGGTISQDLSLGDLDGDGVDDIVVATSAADVEAYTLAGAPLAGWPVPLPVAASGAPVLGHLAGRSAADVLVMTATGLVGLDGGGQRLGAFPKPDLAGTAPTLLELDGDGATEVLAGSGADSSLVVYDAGPRSWNTTPQPWPTGRGDAARTGARPRDSLAPAAVVDLAVANVTPDSVVLAWTAPGDDGMVGTARAYELRTTTFKPYAGSATHGTVVAGVAAPDSAGSPQRAVVLRLAPNTTCWFWLRTIDDADNMSAGSNLAVVTTPDRGPHPPPEFALVAERADRAHVALDWRVRAGSRGDIALYDVTGRRLQRFAVGPAPHGVQQWAGRDAGGHAVPAGVYFARLACGSIHLQTRVVLLP